MGKRIRMETIALMLGHLRPRQSRVGEDVTFRSKRLPFYKRIFLFFEKGRGIEESCRRKQNGPITKVNSLRLHCGDG